MKEGKSKNESAINAAIIGVILFFVVLGIVLGSFTFYNYYEASEKPISIEPSQMENYSGKVRRVIIKITPIEQLPDEREDKSIYAGEVIIWDINYYHTYNTLEGIKVIIEKPEILFLNKTTMAIGVVIIDLKDQGKLVLKVLEVCETKDIGDI
ncbi:MAG: hypothetical protein NTU58_02055 [Candidatus Nealsonbacteria bacterium]|nr:hypothetical protein [Candidatus Nealsonbacteria bacterium]